MYTDMWGAYVGSHVGKGATPAGRDRTGLKSITVFVLLVWGQMLDKQSRLYWLGNLSRGLKQLMWEKRYRYQENRAAGSFVDCFRL